MYIVGYEVGDACFDKISQKDIASRDRSRKTRKKTISANLFKEEPALALA